MRPHLCKNGKTNRNDSTIKRDELLVNRTLQMNPKTSCWVKEDSQKSTHCRNLFISSSITNKNYLWWKKLSGCLGGHVGWLGWSMKEMSRVMLRFWILIGLELTPIERFFQTHKMQQFVHFAVSEFYLKKSQTNFQLYIMICKLNCIGVKYTDIFGNAEELWWIERWINMW